MPFTALTKPVQGDPTRKSLADGIIDDLNYLYSLIAGGSSLSIPNASFESDVDANSLPDQWTRTLYAGGSFALTGDGLADTECQHGRRAIKFIHPGGGGNGGGYIDTDNFIECTPTLPIVINFLHKATAAGMRNKVDVLFYDAAQVAISTTSAYSSITNPTSWLPIIAHVACPSTARFFKLRLIGGENTNTTAGSAYFDHIEARQIVLPRQIILDQVLSGTTNEWVCPAGVFIVQATLIGAGGNGGTGSATLAGGGGGGGGVARATLSVTPGTSYQIVLGAPGTASTFNGLTANSGSNGQNGGAGSGGGAGGTATGGQVNTTGVNGGNGDGPGTDTGGDGGYAPDFGVRPLGRENLDGWAGTLYKYGAGGAGGGGNSNAGGAGANAMLILNF